MFLFCSVGGVRCHGSIDSSFEASAGVGALRAGGQWRWRLRPHAVAAAVRRPMRQDVKSRWRASPSMTAGKLGRIAAVQDHGRIDATRNIITRNDSPDISFDRSINPYRGCEHGCVYCFARPTHAYLGLSPASISRSKLFVKPEAAPLLERGVVGRRTIRRAPSRSAPIPIPTSRSSGSIGSCAASSKCWSAFGHPVGIVTKSALVVRDLDILARMAERSLAKVALSVTTLDPAACAGHGAARRDADPAAGSARGSSPQAGVPASVMVAPMIPALN